MCDGKHEWFYSARVRMTSLSQIKELLHLSCSSFVGSTIDGVVLLKALYNGRLSKLWRLTKRIIWIMWGWVLIKRAPLTKRLNDKIVNFKIMLDYDRTWFFSFDMGWFIVPNYEGLLPILNQFVQTSTRWLVINKVVLFNVLDFWMFFRLWIYNLSLWIQIWFYLMALWIC